MVMDVWRKDEDNSRHGRFSMQKKKKSGKLKRQGASGLGSSKDVNLLLEHKSVSPDKLLHDSLVDDDP